MVLDSSIKSRPISVTVNNPNEINLLFDAISYEKVIFFKKLIEIHKKNFLNRVRQ